MKPQTRAVLDHLIDAGSITNVEANAVLKCRSVAKRISELIDDHNVKIDREWKKDSQGQRYVKYTLASKGSAFAARHRSNLGFARAM